MTRRAHPSGHTASTPGRQSRYPKLWTLRDPETLTLLFQAFEDLTTLRQRCERKIRVAREEERLFDSLLRDDESGLRRWSYVSAMVTPSWSLLDHTVRTSQLDPIQFQEAYRQMLRVQSAWIRLESQPGIQSLIHQITDCLRQLLIRHAQG